MSRRTLKLVLLASLISNLTIVYVGYKAMQYRDYINYWLKKYEGVVEEFSSRHVFADANANLGAVPEGERRVVFIGTQVTRRWPQDDTIDRWQIVPRGVDGQRLAGFLLRFRPDVIQLHPSAVMIEVSSYNFRPDVTVRELMDYTASMADLARANNIAPVIGTIIPPRKGVVQIEDSDYSVDDSLAVFNDWLHQGEAAGRWRLVDFHALLADADGHLRKSLSFSGVDPNEEGYALMTAALDSVLQTIP
jgi:lysophospholipase L1-like esterase